MFQRRKKNNIFNVSKYYCILCLIVSFNTYSQNTFIDESCKSCRLFFEPIAKFDLTMCDTKKAVFDKFDLIEISNNEFLEENPNVATYRVSKNIKLENCYDTKIIGLVKFLDSKLVFFNLSLAIGKDRGFFREIIKMLKSKDSNAFNDYIYQSDKYFYYENIPNCKKLFSLTRNSDNSNLFEISIKYTFTPAENQIEPRLKGNH